MRVHRVVQAVRGIAHHELAQRWGCALGVVASVHGAGGAEVSHACTVELRESGLVLPKVPIAVGVVGQAALPREGDLVVVLFAGGDPHAPIVVGRLYNEEVKPPEHGPGELVVSLPGDETDASRRLELRVTTPGDGTRELALTLDGGVKVEIRVDDEGLQVGVGEATLSVRASGGSDGRAEIKVGDARMLVEQSGDVTLEAPGTLTLKAGNVEIAGDAQVKITGQTVDLN